MLADAADGERLLARAACAEAARLRRRRDTGWSHFWRGYALQFEDLGLARAEWLLAEACFERDGDASGLELTACGFVQCALLDNLSYVGFDERAARIPPATPAAGEATPLALFRIAARLLLAVERREAIDAVADDIERAFAALGRDIEPEIALRVATAALPMLGLGLDRVRGGDFFQAGAAVAASPRVGDYSRALWHLLVVEARFYDATWSAQLRGELDAIDRLAPSDALRPLRARAHMLARRAGARRGRHRGGPREPRCGPSDAAPVASARLLDVPLLLLAPRAAHRRGRRRLGAREGLPSQAGRGVRSRGRPHDDHDAGGLRARRARPPRRSRCRVRARGRAVARRAGDAVHRSRPPDARAAALARRRARRSARRAAPRPSSRRAASISRTSSARCRCVAAELCGAALELDADAAFRAQGDRGARRSRVPTSAIARWPWPLRVRTLGGFAIERDGVPVRFARKAPKRLLDLLRLITALGARHVDAGRVAATLWPDADGDEARDALKTMLYRTRVLLGADFLVVRDGQIGFDEDVTWIDTWAFEHVCGRIESLLGAGTGHTHVDDGELEKRRLQLFSLYRGHLFGEAELPSWALALRDRLRARFIRSVDMLGQRLERTGRADHAIALYRAALEQDNLAEELYQRSDRLPSCAGRACPGAQRLSALPRAAVDRARFAAIGTHRSAGVPDRRPVGRRWRLSIRPPPWRSPAERVGASSGDDPRQQASRSVPYSLPLAC